MTSVKYIGLDVHKESISICVRNSVGKVAMESVIETKASTILQFIRRAAWRFARHLRRSVPHQATAWNY